MKLSQPLSLVLVALSLVASASAQVIGISGVADKGTYGNQVSFLITNDPGNTYVALLDGNPTTVGASVLVNKPDYHELTVTRSNTTTAVVSNRLVRFIVEATERLGTELGIPPHTPFPLVHSSSNEFVGARLRIITPQTFPLGYPVPVVAWVTDSDGHAVRANGFLAAQGQATVTIKRGVGSGFLAATNPAGALNYVPQIGGLGTNKTVTLEAATAWTAVAGTLSGSTTWPPGSRIHITGPTFIPAGSTLTVGQGTIVRVDYTVTITNNGAVVISGTVDEPVVFMPTATGQPWGGFVQHANNASFTATGAIFTGSGGNDPCWFTGHGCSSSVSGIGSHRGEQALVSLNGTNCNLTMIDSAAISLTGQLGHALGGSTKGYDVTLTRFLLQRATTGGEYTSARFTVNDSAFIEFPDDSVDFEDGDNDGLYLVSGLHFFTNTLFGFTKDDGIDSGGTDSSSSPYGRLTYQSCWFEGTFHEGNSLSGYKNVYSKDTVYFNCGQGIEGGYDAPTSRLDHCFFNFCKTGIRHGDNYTSMSGYEGDMLATNCISIYNHRDLFAFNWDSSGGWTNNSGRVFASNNFFSVANPYYPNNALWNPAVDGWRLGAFGGVGHVGVGFAARGTTLAEFPDGIPVGLSRFCTNQVQVGYVIERNDGVVSSGTLIFPQGLTRQVIPASTNLAGVVRVALVNPVNADVTGVSSLYFQNIPPATAPVLSPLGAVWKYLDNGTDQGTAWRGTNFDDSAWSSGPARLGFGADAAATTILRRYLSGTSGPQYTNYYFRRAINVGTNPASFSALQFRYQRDDGCVIYLNGNPVVTNNMPAGPITYMTFASGTISGSAETQRYWTNLVPPSLLLPGTNWLAAEVHQVSTTSSDIAWELEVQGLPTIAQSAPRVNLTLFGPDAVVYWNDPTFVLEEADIVTGPWRYAAKTNSPSAAPISGNRFFRLSR